MQECNNYIDLTKKAEGIFWCQRIFEPEKSCTKDREGIEWKKQQQRFMG